jgi:hypothetical protein
MEFEEREYDIFEVGDRVMCIIDNEPLFGTVAESEDPHNVLVKYDDDRGQGFYCVVKGCDMDGQGESDYGKLIRI